MNETTNMDISTSFKNSLSFSGICSISIVVVFTYALCNDILRHCKVLSVPGIIFLVPSIVLALSVACFAGLGFSEKKNKYLLHARTLATISIPWLILCLNVVFFSASSEKGRCFGGVFTFYILEVSVAFLATSYIPLRVAIELHVKNEGGRILPMSESIREAYQDIRSLFVYGRAGVANVINKHSITIKVKRRGDELYREIEISQMIFGSTLLDQLKVLIAAKFDYKPDEIHQLIQNNDKIIETDEDVNRLTSDDVIEVLFHELEVNITTPLLDQVAYNAPPLYTPEMNV